MFFDFWDFLDFVKWILLYLLCVCVVLCIIVFGWHVAIFSIVRETLSNTPTAMVSTADVLDGYVVDTKKNATQVYAYNTSTDAPYVLTLASDFSNKSSWEQYVQFVTDDYDVSIVDAKCIANVAAEQ